MNEKDSFGEFYLDDLSDCVHCTSASSSDDESDSSSIIIRQRRSLLPLIYSDSEDDDINNNVEDNPGTWSTNAKTIILEPLALISLK
ncbi:hypothetical protein M0802_010773 [Mischocyttarus mexicanus]|nr:hypothetical protein M0802_010764 [Mischocyttarus mexicanus]KAI4490305.1 hypothetical protein M0802_010773 [Mischocyttarus mexicanus]